MVIINLPLVVVKIVWCLFITIYQVESAEVHKINKFKKKEAGNGKISFPNWKECAGKFNARILVYLFAKARQHLMIIV